MASLPFPLKPYSGTLYPCQCTNKNEKGLHARSLPQVPHVEHPKMERNDGGLLA